MPILCSTHWREKRREKKKKKERKREKLAPLAPYVSYSPDELHIHGNTARAKFYHQIEHGKLLLATHLWAYTIGGLKENLELKTIGPWVLLNSSYTQVH